MLTLFRGDLHPPRVRRVQRQIAEDVTSTEVNPLVQSTRSGRFKDGVRLGDERVWISPLLGDLVLEDFAPEFAFGNGATGGRDMIVRDRVVNVTWVVFPYDVQLTDANLQKLQEIMEGIPPGSDVPNVHRPFARDGALEPDLVGPLLVELQGKTEKTLSEEHLIEDLLALQAGSRVIPAVEPPTPSLIEVLADKPTETWADAEFRELVQVLAKQTL